jgi:hypothetical protein
VGAIGDDDGGSTSGPGPVSYGPNRSRVRARSAARFPRLAAESSLQPAAPFVLRLEQVARKAPPLLISTTANKKPFQGDAGARHLRSQCRVMVFTDKHGEVTLVSSRLPGIAAGFDLICSSDQDHDAVGYASSNALRGTP